MSLPAPDTAGSPAGLWRPAEFTSNAIQDAVDACAAAGGGTVQLPPGTYAILAPVRLSSGVALIGSGTTTLLRKSPGGASPLAVDADYGDTEVIVTDPTPFRVGMGLQVFDEERRWGWDESTAIITGISGSTLRLDRRLQRDYRADRGGQATNACALLSVEEAADVQIRDLLVEGSRATNTYLGGCRGGAIYLHGVDRCTIRGVEVRAFNGDGISWQITHDITVEGCRIHGCAGAGLHPGSGSRRTRILDCESTGNDECGLFVCWRVQQGEIRGNRFNRNGHHGLSIGHKDSDNLISENEFVANGRSGVLLRPERPSNGAQRNRWERNRFIDNGEGPESCAVLVHPHHEANEFTGNELVSTVEGRQRWGFRVLPGSPPLTLRDQQVVGPTTLLAPAPLPDQSA